MNARKLVEGSSADEYRDLIAKYKAGDVYIKAVNIGQTPVGSTVVLNDSPVVEEGDSGYWRVSYWSETKQEKYTLPPDKFSVWYKPFNKAGIGSVARDVLANKLRLEGVAKRQLSQEDRRAPPDRSNTRPLQPPKKGDMYIRTSGLGSTPVGSLVVVSSVYNNQEGFRPYQELGFGITVEWEILRSTSEEGENYSLPVYNFLRDFSPADRGKIQGLARDILKEAEDKPQVGDYYTRYRGVGNTPVGAVVVVSIVHPTYYAWDILSGDVRPRGRERSSVSCEKFEHDFRRLSKDELRQHARDVLKEDVKTPEVDSYYIRNGYDIHVTPKDALVCVMKNYWAGGADRVQWRIIDSTNNRLNGTKSQDLLDNFWQWFTPATKEDIKSRAKVNLGKWAEAQEDEDPQDGEYYIRVSGGTTWTPVHSLVHLTGQRAWGGIVYWDVVESPSKIAVGRTSWSGLRDFKDDFARATKEDIRQFAKKTLGRPHP